MKPIDPIAEAGAVLADYSARAHVPIIHEKGDRAYYSPARDEVHLPLRDQFIHAAEYYSTAFHESVHSTGHEKRLNRLSNRKKKLMTVTMTTAWAFLVEWHKRKTPAGSLRQGEV